MQYNFYYNNYNKNEEPNQRFINNCLWDNYAYNLINNTFKRRDKKF